MSTESRTNPDIKTVVKSQLLDLSETVSLLRKSILEQVSEIGMDIRVLYEEMWSQRNNESNAMLDKAFFDEISLNDFDREKRTVKRIIENEYIEILFYFIEFFGEEKFMEIYRDILLNFIDNKEKYMRSIGKGMLRKMVENKCIIFK